MAPYLRETREGVELLLLIQPRASKTRIVGEHDGRLKVSVDSQTVDGAANEALLEFLADMLSVGNRALLRAQGVWGRGLGVLVTGALRALVEQALEGGA